ncbi:hypothetical protein [Kitasatospora mediocidica]|uniref:hypothetical protein n=1 Tax=Kitasatospora mediocidica TaxID=58352 RepID=UPI00056239AC|nr:hypothetical protein [Kitasatospora mediocidica]
MGVGGDQDVGGLQVAVNHVDAVDRLDRLERFGDAAEQQQDGTHRQRAVLAHHLLELTEAQQEAGGLHRICRCSALCFLRHHVLAAKKRSEARAHRHQ